MKKKIVLVTVLSLLCVNVVKAGETKPGDIVISGNGANSSNSITIDNDKSSTVEQGGSVDIQNNVNANASTGNNSVSGNSNGNNTIITGNANVTSNISNNGNTNTLNPSPKPTTTPQPTNTPNGPTATPQPSNPGSGSGSNSGLSGSNSSSSNSSSSPSQTGGSGNGEVMGLAATSGTDIPSFLSSVAGFVCLAVGSALLTRRERVR